MLSAWPFQLLILLFGRGSASSCAQLEHLSCRAVDLFPKHSEMIVHQESSRRSWGWCNQLPSMYGVGNCLAELSIRSTSELYIARPVSCPALPLAAEPLIGSAFDNHNEPPRRLSSSSLHQRCIDSWSPTCAMTDATPSSLNSNIINYLVWRYLQEASMLPQPSGSVNVVLNDYQALRPPRTSSRKSGTGTPTPYLSQSTMSRVSYGIWLLTAFTSTRQ